MNSWKRKFIQKSESVFVKGSVHGIESKEKLIETLYSRIGEWSVANEFLKKTAVRTLSERKAMIEPKHPQLSIVKQCDLLCLNRSSIYYEPAKESEDNLQILSWLDNRYQETPFAGARKLIKELEKHGYKLNMKRLRRLMAIQGWRTLYQEPSTTVSDPTKYKYSYLLKELKIERRNQVWALDITYGPMRKGFMYLCAIIDIHTRYVVGWGLSNSMTAEWVVGIISDAILVHGRPEIMNSDQGSQFTSDLYVSLLQREGILISMDDKG